MPLDPQTLAIAAAALLAGGLLALLLLRLFGRERGGDRAAELDSRLKFLADSLANAQSQTQQQLHNQERQIAKALDERLGDFSKKVGDRLQETSTQQQNSLTALRERLAVIDKAQENIAQVSTQVTDLQNILANNQARGAFGEVLLNNLIQDILPPSAYELQARLSNGRNPDCLLKLPNPPGSIAIDAKFPRSSYEALRAAKDEAARLQAARAFAADVKKHVVDISERYILPGETAESALMFLPSEAVYAELHSNFPNVVEESYRRRVWIVSPTTLMALLNTVRAVLKDVRMREQAHVIQEEVHKMLKDVARLDDRVGSLENHFQQANKDIGLIRTSADKITRKGEKITEIELGPSGEEADEETQISPPRQVLPFD
ncbi:MAG: DNA recombination protein RmuC [Rhodovibrionaceae bacterium]